MRFFEGVEEEVERKNVSYQSASDGASKTDYLVHVDILHYTVASHSYYRTMEN